MIRDRPAPHVELNAEHNLAAPAARFVHPVVDEQGVEHLQLQPEFVLGGTAAVQPHQILTIARHVPGDEGLHVTP